jgi:hypothetical protein
MPFFINGSKDTNQHIQNSVDLKLQRPVHGLTFFQSPWVVKKPRPSVSQHVWLALE